MTWAKLVLGPPAQAGAWTRLLLRPAGRAKVSFFAAAPAAAGLLLAVLSLYVLLLFMGVLVATCLFAGFGGLFVGGGNGELRVWGFGGF